ncbi:hypothetical protein TrST_g7876 [Triparma strigata]|uniref:Uncharacterized protein n=1 Tax=Triparma strigata TaxID=1606541 RepID=A0A9W7B4U2_9STRA|nr:hypothetical protein TrST_g7876 [Triparma strigata]
MNKEFRKTFYSIETGKQHAAKLFFEGNDLIKANSFRSHSSYWKEFEEPLQIWLDEGWSSWEDEKPDWFTEAWRKRVPEHMVTQASTSASGSAFSVISTQGSGRNIGKGAGGRGTRKQHKNVVKNLKATQILPALEGRKEGGNQEEGLGYTENQLKNAMGRRGSMKM